MKRTSSLKPGRSLKRNPPKRLHGVVSFIWRRDLGPCVVCPFEGGECAGSVQGHHVVSREALRKRGLLAYEMDLRNRLSVCERRHSQHTNKFKAIPREVLPASVFEFAAELGFSYYLDRHYKSAVLELECDTAARSSSKTAGDVGVAA